MKLRIFDAAALFTALSSFAIENKVPFWMAHTLNRNLKALASNVDLKSYEEGRIKLIQETFGTPDASGNLSVPPGKKQAFQEKLKPVGDKEVEFDLETIPIRNVPPSINISMAEYLALEKIFTEDVAPTTTPIVPKKRHTPAKKPVAKGE
jgi:hypothetical protein